MNCHAVEGWAPRLVKAIAHADVEAVDPTDAGAGHLDVAVVEVAETAEGGMDDHRSSSC